MSKPAMNMASSTTGSISQRRGLCAGAVAAGAGRAGVWRDLAARDWALSTSRSSFVRSSSKFDKDRTVLQVSNYSQPRAMLGSVMDDGVEPAAEDIELLRVLAALADPHRLAAVRFVASHG